jgi:hypothetical protein
LTHYTSDIIGLFTFLSYAAKQRPVEHYRPGGAVAGPESQIAFEGNAKLDEKGPESFHR